MAEAIMVDACCLPHCEGESSIKQACGHHLCNADGLKLLTISANGAAALKCPLCRNFCHVCPAMLREMLVPVPTHAALLRCGCERPECSIAWVATHTACRRGCHACAESCVTLLQLPAESQHPESDEDLE